MQLRETINRIKFDWRRIGLKRLLYFCLIIVSFSILILDYDKSLAKRRIEKIVDKSFAFCQYCKQNISSSDYEVIKLSYSAEVKQLLEKYKKDSPPSKLWVPAVLTRGNEKFECEIRLHGGHDNHRYNSDNQCSYAVKLLKDGQFLDGKRRFQLMVAGESSPSRLISNNFGCQYGLIAGQFNLVELIENGEERGVYGLLEDPTSKEYLERELGITKYAEISPEQIWSDAEYYGHKSFLGLSANIIKPEKGVLYRRASEEYRRMVSTIDSNKNSSWSLKYFDEEYMGRFLALIVILNDSHFYYGDNLKMIYNYDNGKFYPVWRPEVGHREHTAFFKKNQLQRENSNLTPNWGLRDFDLQPFNSVYLANGEYRYNDETAKIFKSLIRDERFRNARNKFLLQLLEGREEFLSSVEREVEKGLAYHSSNSFFTYSHHYEISKKDYLPHIKNSFVNIEKYLSYGHVHVTYNKPNDAIEVYVDSFVPLVFEIPQNSGLLKKEINGFYYNEDLEREFRSFSFSSLPSDFSKKDLLVRNTITGFALSDSDIFFRRTSAKGYVDVDESGSRSEFLRNQRALEDYGVQFAIEGDCLTLKSGQYKLDHSIIIDGFEKVTFDEGCTLELAEGVNLFVETRIIVANGTEKDPVVIRRSDKTKDFGACFFIGRGVNARGRIDNLIVDGGSTGSIRGFDATGQLAIHNMDLEITNSLFKNSKGDDGLNLKSCRAEISNCRFVENYADQIDLDFCIATLDGCTFKPSKIDPNGDGVDFSGSFALLKGCNFDSFLDKAVSVGEKSFVLIETCKITNSNNGIAVKDSSRIYLSSNYFNGNSNNYTKYIKKPIFSNPEIYFLGDLNESSDGIVSKVIDAGVIDWVKNMYKEKQESLIPTSTLEFKQGLLSLINELLGD